MPDLFDSDGKAVVAFTDEEVKEKIEAANKTAEEENTTKITGLEEQVKTLGEEKTKLEEGKGKTDEEGKTDKEMNFEKMRTLVDEKDTKIEGLQTQINNLSTGFDQKLDAKKIEDAISALSSGDKDLTAKIQFHFNNFKIDPEEAKDPVKSAEGLKKRLENAYMLATGGTPAPALQSDIISSAGGFVPPAAGDKPKGKLSDDAKKMGTEKFGITEEEMKTAEDKGLI